jgi:hypothetical protein
MNMIEALLIFWMSCFGVFDEATHHFEQTSIPSPNAQRGKQSNQENQLE